MAQHSYAKYWEIAGKMGETAKNIEELEISWTQRLISRPKYLENRLYLIREFYKLNKELDELITADRAAAETYCQEEV